MCSCVSVSLDWSVSECLVCLSSAEMYCYFVLVCWRELVFESLCVCSVFRVLHFEVILCLCVNIRILWVSLCVFCVYRVSSFVCEMETLPNRQFAAFADISSLKNGLYLSQK